jgi:hypothetical protein
MFLSDMPVIVILSKSNDDPGSITISLPSGQRFSDCPRPLRMHVPLKVHVIARSSFLPSVIVVPSPKINDECAAKLMICGEKSSKIISSVFWQIGSY